MNSAPYPVTPAHPATRDASGAHVCARWIAGTLAGSMPQRVLLAA